MSILPKVESPGFPPERAGFSKRRERGRFPEAPASGIILPWHALTLTGFPFSIGDSWHG